MDSNVVCKRQPFTLSGWLKIALVSALALLLMLTVRVPIFPLAPFLTYDFSEVPALVLGFILGPWAGIAVVVIKNGLFLFLNFQPLELIGIPANLITGVTLIGSACGFRAMRCGGGSGERLGAKSGPLHPGLGRAMVAASVLTTVVMVFVNLLIYWLLKELFFEMVPMSLVGYLLGAILPFNALKCTITCLLAAWCLKKMRIGRAGKTSRIEEGAGENAAPKISNADMI